jgi:hypothetical protein
MSPTILSSDSGAHASAGDKKAGDSFLEIDARAFRESFNRQAFVIRHNLSRHPLFELPRLIELSKLLPEDHVAYSAGDVSVAEGLYNGPRNGLSIEETIRRIEDCRSWMVLKFVQTDPEYGESSTPRTARSSRKKTWSGFTPPMPTTRPYVSKKSAGLARKSSR